MATTRGYLPGVYFKPPPAAQEAVLPRMDIGLFVGFAATGPLHTPVKLEDAAQFAANFGADVELCWDDQRAEVVSGYLGMAVRAFFRNGGRRCWVVRVPHESFEEDQTEPTRLAFSAELFLDDRLSDAVSIYDLQTRVQAYRSQQAGRAGFTGIYAALDPGDDCDMDQVTLIAVPDAVQLGWERPVLPPIELPQPSALPDHPAWWHFMGCVPVSDSQLTAASVDRTQPDRAEFQDGDLVLLQPPNLNPASVAADGTLTLSWVWLPPAGLLPPVTFVLEEARLPDWRDAAVIYTGAGLTFVLRGRRPGDYYYRVRVQTPNEVSNWSAGIAARVPGAQRWFQSTTVDLQNQRRLHRALLLLCAARGDCVAVLTLPRPVRELTAIDHCNQLRALVDERTASFGALYHPWLVGHAEAQPEVVHAAPPDGAVCGVMAARALDRGAWISPANEPLQNVFTLDPHLRGDLFDLAERGVNLIWQRPRGFLALSAQTLSLDPDWRDLNVRRLMCLLRRLALSHGARYVFEPNNATFRRTLQHGFENLLRQLFLRGAFAGRLAAEAYRVVVDAQINSQQTMDLGQLIIELRVAPSLPLKFMTVQLVQSHERTLIQETA